MFSESIIQLDHVRLKIIMESKDSFGQLSHDKQGSPHFCSVLFYYDICGSAFNQRQKDENIYRS